MLATNVHFYYKTRKRFFDFASRYVQKPLQIMIFADF